MMDLKNKSELEQYFAENFDTVFFPLLADLYKKENDLDRARKVCEIGLEYHPSNIPGAFILAEVNQSQGNLVQAEKFYKQILNNCPWHYRALVNLVKIETELNRSEDTISKLWTRIVRINPTHTEARLYLKLPPVKEPTPLKITSITPERKKPIKDESLKKKTQEIKKQKPKELKNAKKSVKETKAELKPEKSQPEEKKAEKKRITNKVGQTKVVEEKPSKGIEDQRKDFKEKPEKKEEKIHKEDPVETEKVKSEQKGKKPVDGPKKVDEAVEDLKKKLETPKEQSAEKDIFKEMAVKNEETKSPKPPAIKQEKLNEEELQSLDITPRMATFTMVNVLKKQKLYQQALYVLNMLEEKGADQALIDQERQTIQELLDKSETE